MKPALNSLAIPIPKSLLQQVAEKFTPASRDETISFEYRETST